MSDDNDQPCEHCGRAEKLSATDSAGPGNISLEDGRELVINRPGTCDPEPAALPLAIEQARTVMHQRGFRGTPVVLQFYVTDGEHHLRVVDYQFSDGTRHPYVEAVETHDALRPAKIWPLSGAVHLLQNVADDDFYRIGGRE